MFSIWKLSVFQNCLLRWCENLFTRRFKSRATARTDGFSVIFRDDLGWFVDRFVRIVIIIIGSNISINDKKRPTSTAVEKLSRKG